MCISSISPWSWKYPNISTEGCVKHYLTEEEMDAESSGVMEALAGIEEDERLDDGEVEIETDDISEGIGCHWTWMIAPLTNKLLQNWIIPHP